MEQTYKFKLRLFYNSIASDNWHAEQLGVFYSMYVCIWEWFKTNIWGDGIQWPREVLIKGWV